MQALFDPAILFFLLGVLAGFLKSNLEVPPQISRFLALYLLMALGLKGGFALAKSGFTSDVAMALVLALLLAVLIPGIGYLLMRKLLAPFDVTLAYIGADKRRFFAFYGAEDGPKEVGYAERLARSAQAYERYLAAL